MSDDGLIHEELERLAQAHLAMDAADEASESNATASALSADMDVTPEVAMSILQASRGAFASSHPKEQMALVSVPSGLPTDWLFRLEIPVESSDKLEKSLGLEKNTLQGIMAAKTSDSGENVEDVLFVFVTDELKRMISRWIEHEGVSITPLFVKLAKTTQGAGPDGNRAILDA